MIGSVGKRRDNKKSTRKRKFQTGAGVNIGSQRKNSAVSHQQQLDSGFPWLRFSPAFEPAFRADYLSGAVPLRIILLVVSILFLLATPMLERMLGAPNEHLEYAWKVQFLLINPALVLALIVTYVPRFRGGSDRVTVLASVAVVVGVLLQRSHGASLGFDVPLEYTVTTIASIFILGRVRFGLYLPVALLLLVAMLFNEWWFVQPPRDGWYRVAVAVMLVGLGILGGYSFEYLLRVAWLNEQRLIGLSNQDPLTLLLNRRGFDEAAQRAMRQAVRQQKRFGVMMLDLDHFKRYNDAHGHAAGDDCLKTFSSLLERSAKRPLDCCGRYGGEEFVAAFFDCEPEQLQRIAEDLRKQTKGMQTASPTSWVTVSIGAISLLPDKDADLGDIIMHADRLLYRAKDQGEFIQQMGFI